MPVREVRDAIHGLVELQPEEWKVINTFPFQRLRGIQQLALTHLVYPGARHSRFEHSIGACHIAGQIADRLELPSRGLVRMAALVHDIGHGPFSHVSEEVMQRHEDVSAAIVRDHPDVRAAIGDMATEIADLLVQTGAGAKRSIERDIIAGPADADKFDYLLRDSHFCGVEYGRYDLEKVTESSRMIPEFGATSALGFHEDAVYALEEMVLARHHMHRQVYAHKTRLATDRMLVKAMQLGIDEGVLPSDVFRPTGDLDESFVVEFIKWDDASVTRKLCDSDDTKSRELMRSLLSRRLYKRVLRLGEEELATEFSQPLAGAVAVPAEEALTSKLVEVEASIAASAGIEPHWVTLLWENLANPVASRLSLRIEDREIVLVTDEGQVRRFVDASEIFQNAEFPSRPYVSLFARPEGETFDADQLDALRSATLDGLKEIGQATLEL